MKQAEPFLHPKLSSIYNKIFQLVAATLLIILLMIILSSIEKKNNENLTEHAHYIAKQQLQQAIAGLTVIFEQDVKNNAIKHALLQRYLDGLVKANFVNQAHLYDKTGKLLVASVSIEKDKQGNNLPTAKAKSINDLYGISSLQRNMSGTLTPYIEEVKFSEPDNDTLHGYIRFTVEQSYLTDILAKQDTEQQSLQRLMLLLAGVVGFLLTRGSNRFSRRGYRLRDAADKR